MTSPAVKDGPIEFASSPWHVHMGEPTTLLVFCAGVQPPAREETIARLRARGAAEPETPTELPEQPDVLWQHELTMPCVRGSAVVWCEHAQPVQPGTFSDSAIETAPWIIGIQALLHVDDPTESYAELFRLLISALPDSPGLLDVNTNMCHPREFICEQLSLNEAPAPTDWLWRIDVVASQSETTAQTPVWLRTAGLHRCWRAELEMFNVPYGHASAAGRLLDLLAEQSLDGPLPDAGTIFEIGAELTIMLQPVEAILDSIQSNAPGSPAFRHANNINADRPTAVIVATNTTPASSTVNPPLDVLRSVHSGDAAVFRTTRTTARQAALARARWPEFVNAWQAAQKSYSRTADHHFLINAALTTDQSSSADREHLWFEVESITDGIATAKPLRAAMTTNSLTTTDQCTLDPAGISDWLIITPTSRIGPQQMRVDSDEHTTQAHNH